MKQRVDLIPAQESDLPQLTELAAICFSDPWSETIFRQTLENPYSEIWCAVHENIIAGYLALSRTGDDWNVDDIAVHPSYRRQGIARQLLTMAHQRFPDSCFLLEVRESNADAMTLYQSLGYQQVGFRKRYYTHPEEGAILMHRNAEKLDK